MPGIVSKACSILLASTVQHTHRCSEKRGQCSNWQARESLVMLAEAAARATGACQQCAPLATALQRAVASEVAALEAAAQATGDGMS
eukprot:6454907-Amphidinium_carterae.1